MAGKTPKQPIDPTQQLLEDVRRRLDVIISLMIEERLEKEKVRTADDQVVRLTKAGLRPIEIARITGRAASNVNRDISNARKTGKLPKTAPEGGPPEVSD